MCQETFLKWPQVLPPGLLWVRVQPQPKLNELMFGVSYSAATFPASEKLIRNWEIEQCLILSGNLLNELKRFVILSEPLTLDSPVHSFQPGDHLHIQIWKPEPFQEQWKGLYLVLLTTRSAVKVKGINSWIPCSQNKRTPDSEWIVENTGSCSWKCQRHLWTSSKMYGLIFMGIILSLGRGVEENFNIDCNPRVC